MKINLLFSFIFLGQILSAQIFTEASDAPFEGVQYSSVAFSDVDGDDDQDVLITGRNSSDIFISKLYINDGVGNFTEAQGTSFEGVWSGSVAFSDVDGDNDQDVLITGGNSSGNRISTLYTNDGAGNFTEVSAFFNGVGASSVAFSDVDGDNDQDVLITGQNNSDYRLSVLYINDGTGNFTPISDNPFEGISAGFSAFSDVDGDNDQDLLIIGRNNSDVPISKLYTNDGQGDFSQVMGTPFDGVQYSSIALSDVDGDNDYDVFITGRNNSDFTVSKLYTNDGQGSFIEVIGTSFDGVFFSSAAFSDVDGNNDQDLLITGWNSSLDPISKLYTNNGTGSFMEVMTPFDDVAFGSIAFSDVDGDGDQDVLITGRNNADVPISKLYINESIVSTENVVSQLSFEFKLYPNPTKTNTINVSYDSKESTWVDVNIFDLKGQLVKQHQEHIGVGNQTFAINISSLSRGTYTIQLDDGVRRGSQKFVVE